MAVMLVIDENDNDDEIIQDNKANSVDKTTIDTWSWPEFPTDRLKVYV